MNDAYLLYASRDSKGVPDRSEKCWDEIFKPSEPVNNEQFIPIDPLTNKPYFAVDDDPMGGVWVAHEVKSLDDEPSRSFKIDFGDGKITTLD